jgi:hypothetical protein
MRQAQTRALFNHWRSLCRDGSPPDRNELEPAAFAAALQDVFILGRGADGIWRYRVAGTRLSAYADRDLRDEPFTTWWQAADRADITRLLASTASERAPATGGVSGHSVRGDRHDTELLLLPLRHGGQDGLRLIGGLFPAPETARLHDVRLATLAVLSIRSIAEAGQPGDAFGKPRTDIDSLVERRARFRVYEGGRSAGPGA